MAFLRALRPLGLWLAAACATSCIVPAPRESGPPEPARDKAPGIEETLARGKSALEAKRYEEALSLARGALEQARARKTAPRTLATLHQLEADALWELEDPEAYAVYARALAIWESIPGADLEVADACVSLALALGLSLEDFTRAEAYARRALAIRERLKGESDDSLFMPLLSLLDTLDQQCRAAEAAPLMDRAEALARRRPTSFVLHVDSVLHFRSLFARRLGDVSGAIEWRHRQIASARLAGRPEDASLVQQSIAYSGIAELERERANYVTALGYVERAKELADRVTNPYSVPELWPAELHFAYEAAGDPRLAAHDARERLVWARAGGELFPASLPAVGACSPEAGPSPKGRFLRYRSVRDHVAACLEPSQATQAEGALLVLLMRIENARVMAAEALARKFEPSVVRCVADRALSYQAPPGRYAEFAQETLP